MSEADRQAMRTPRDRHAATDGGPLSRLSDALLSVPGHVPSEFSRYYTYWKIFYALAGIAHLTVLLLFLRLGVLPMAVFGVLSVAVYILAFALLQRGYFRTAFWCAIVELVGHGVAATLYVGVDYGFQYYPLLVLILLFIQPFYGVRVASFVAALTLGSAAGITYYALHAEPIQPLSGAWAEFLTLTMLVLWPVFVLVMVLPFIRASARAEKEVQTAYAESERLLLNILPPSIAKRLKASDDMIADHHARVGVLFADIAGFTSMSSRLPPEQVVLLLNEVFNIIDDLVERHGAEKIKTIGDAYMVVTGLPEPSADPEGTIARLALDIRDAVRRIQLPGSEEPLRIRIGIHSGDVVAGVIGNRKFAYDIWGDTVNVASRVEASGEPGQIHLTEALAKRLSDRFDFSSTQISNIKGKGETATCFLLRRRP